jgi:hypothetical protein
MDHGEQVRRGALQTIADQNGLAIVLSFSG